MKYIIVFALALSVQQASAQFGNILNRLEYSAKSKLEGAAVDAAEKAGRNALDSAKKTAKKSKKNKAEAQTWTYGDHTYTMKGNLTADKYKKDAFGEVTFTNIPTDYNEFEALYSEFLGRTPHGAAAMIPMAMEMYARDREMGKKCIELLSYPSNVNSIISRLKDKFGSDESYGQRYLPAAVLEGATAANGYKPNRPYTVTMEASVNKHQELPPDTWHLGRIGLGNRVSYEKNSFICNSMPDERRVRRGTDDQERLEVVGWHCALHRYHR